MKNRIIAAGILTVLLTVLFTACSSGSKDNNATTRGMTTTTNISTTENMTTEDASDLMTDDSSTMEVTSLTTR